MFGLGTGEIVFILALALIIFGPARIPEFARGIGAGLKTIRELFVEFKDKSGIQEIEGELHKTKRVLNAYSRNTLRLDPEDEPDNEPEPTPEQLGYSQEEKDEEQEQR